LLASRMPLQSPVLKVAHHGSKSSSSAEFLARVAPRVAVISAESGGLVNLPSPETVDLLRAAGARVFRTDLDGAVTVEMKGYALTVRSYGGLPVDSTTGAAGATRNVR
jgi:competence protein ComEC